MTDGIPPATRHVIEVHVLLRRQAGKQDHQVALAAFHEGVQILKNSQQLVDMETDDVEGTHRAPADHRRQKVGEGFALDLPRVTGGQLAALQDIMIMTGQQGHITNVGRNKEGVHRDGTQGNAASARFRSGWLLHKL